MSDQDLRSLKIFIYGVMGLGLAASVVLFIVGMPLFGAFGLLVVASGPFVFSGLKKEFQVKDRTDLGNVTPD